MQALSCGSPSVSRGVMTTLELDDVPQLDKSEVAKPATERLLSTIRLAATKPDLGTPMRVPLDSNGQRLCPTPKSVRALGGMKSHASRPHDSPGVHDLRQPNFDKSVDLGDQPAPNFTMYSNPTFEPLVTIVIPTSVQKQPSCLPVDSNGQRLCPTPKSTRSSSSPGASKSRFSKATSFQPLDTIQSPAVVKDQTKRVLGDSNGQWTQGTPKVSKKYTTPRARSTAFGSNCSENMTPRALFNDSHVVAPRSISRVSSRAAKEPTSSELSPELEGPKCSSTAKNAVGSKIKKRARGEDDAASEDDNTRITRSRTEAEKIAIFLRSPAVRVRPDGTRQEYQHGVSDLLTKQSIGEMIRSEDSMKKPSLVECDDSSMEESSLNLEGVKPLVSRRLPSVQESPVIRVRVHSPGRGRSSLLRSPLVTSSKKQSEKKIPASRNGKSTPQGSAKKNLSVLLEAEK